MELEELKKSWNALDEHLKDKKIVKDEDISRLINHATKNIDAMSRLNKTGFSLIFTIRSFSLP